MVHSGDTIEPGLHLVSVPIGAARDITLRALDILAAADVLAAEDTRSLRRLMDIHGVALGDRPLIAYHDHNGAQVRPRLLAALRDGKSVAYASEAGTPLIADPGFALAAEARAEGLAIRAAPGASAVLAALCVGGLPTDRFLFGGFLPSKSKAREAALTELGAVPATLVLYESPKRVAATLAAAATCLGPRQARLCRELTKRFEDVWTGTLPDLAQRAASEAVRGEVVLLIDRAQDVAVSEEDLRDQLATLMQTESLKSAVKRVSERTGVSRKEVYDLALRLRGQ